MALGAGGLPQLTVRFPFESLLHARNGLGEENLLCRHREQGARARPNLASR